MIESSRTHEIELTYFVKEKQRDALTSFQTAVNIKVFGLQF